MITYKIALRIAWTAFITVLMIGLITVVVLSLGAADPPKAGLLQSHTENLVYAVRKHEHYIFPQQLNLPAPPYTLEIGCTFAANSDLMAIWGISLIDASDDSNKVFGVYLNGYQFYSVPPAQPDFTPFIHIRKPGIANKITLHVEADKHVTLRLNDEIAWRGTIAQASMAQIHLKGGISQSTTLTINFIDLYYPTR